MTSFMVKKGDDTLSTGNGNDHLFGDEGNDRLIINGTGSMTVDGGEGSDTLIIDTTNLITPDVENFQIYLSILNGETGGFVNGDYIASDTIKSIENIEFQGDIPLIIEGDSNNNIFIGGDGSDTIIPNGGIDIVTGGLSYDYFQSAKNQENLTIRDYENWEYITFYDMGELYPDEFLFDENSILEQVSILTDEGKTQISIETSSGSWENIVTLDNGEFQLEKLELDFSDSPEAYNTLTLSLSDPDSDDVYHQNNDVFYYFYDQADFYYINDSIDNIELRIDDDFGFNSESVHNQFTSTYDILNNETIFSIDGNAVQKQDFIKIKGEYEVISSIVENSTTSGSNGWLTLETRRVLENNLGTDIDDTTPNEAPVITSYGSYLFVQENIPTDQVVYTVVANDPNDDALIYSLSGTDALEINSNGELTFIDTPDYESNAFYSFTINVSDGDLSASQYVSLFVSNIVETSVVEGGDSFDALVGGSESDNLYGGYGKDVLTGGLGDDILDGGAGKDTVVFGDNNTRLYLSDAYDGIAQDTGHGNDTIMTSTIENVTTGGGNDIIVANTADNIVLSGGGNDRLYGADGDDTLSGGDGDDRLYGSYGRDSMSGGDGNDRLYGDYGNDILNGGLGDDRIDGGAGKDTIVFGDNNTVLSLSNDYDGLAQNTGHGSDTIVTSTIENVTTGSGNDIIIANAFDNVILSGDGDDRLYGDAGDDTLTAGLGNDRMYGSYGDDSLTGGDGDDHLYGEYGE